MKKNIFVFLMVCIIVFSVYSQNGVIRELTGDVELKLAGTTVFIPARAGAAVAQDTIVSTGFRSTVIIEIGSNSITVQPLTRLSLSEIQSSSNTENLNINLQAGRIKVDVKPPAGTRANTTVQSPSATASVRGTSFIMDPSRVQVLEGRIGWSGSDGVEVPVFKGKSNSITIEGVPHKPVEIIESGVMPLSPVGSGSSGEGSSAPAIAGEDVELTVGWHIP